MLFKHASALEIRVMRPDDLETVVDFFDRTASEPQPVDERTVALTPPAVVVDPLARREVRVYLRLLELLAPGVGADIVD